MNAALARNFQLPLLDVIKNHPGANFADAYRSMIRLALNRGLPPVKDLDFSGIQRVSVFLPPALSAQLAVIADEHKINIPTIAAGLAQAGADFVEESTTETPVIADKDVPFPAKPQQSIFYKEIIKGLNASKIVVAEASTGIGKGRALMAAAAHAALMKNGPVLVAAPTIVVVNQLWDELQALRKDSPSALEVSATILPGSTEFADDLKLKEWLKDEIESGAKTDPDVEEWIRQGAPHVADDAIGQVAREQGISLSWLMSDLYQIASNISVSDFTLETSGSDKRSEDSESRSVLKAIRLAANRKIPTDAKQDGKAETMHAGADVILCTHAMLALGQKTNWTILPKPGVVIVDEAHLLEQTISQINSHQISLASTCYQIGRFCRTNQAKKHSIPRRALATARLFMKKCQALSINDSQVRLNESPEYYKSISDGLVELAGILRSKAFSSDHSIQKTLSGQLLAAAAMMNNLKTRSSAYLQFSPDRRYPRISVGAETIDREAGAIWKAAEHGAILASATMYIVDEYGEQKCDYVVRNLAIPLTRLYTFIPVVADYIYTLPTMHVPTSAQYAGLSRPCRDDTQGTNAWLKNIALHIATIAKNSEGGTLVLTSAYDQIEGISDHLNEIDQNLSDRLVIQKRGVKFAKNIDQYKAIYKSGKRPVWIGLGPAWTGLNLLDEDASDKKDTLLTDLVVACCPIGLNQSPTMQIRIERTHTAAIAKEALLTFKQGLGRIIRRNNVKHRHIWMLDARLWKEPKWLPQFSGSAKRLLSKYKQTAPLNDALFN